jgi:hypothetical protein
MTTATYVKAGSHPARSCIELSVERVWHRFCQVHPRTPRTYPLSVDLGVVTYSDECHMIFAIVAQPAQQLRVYSAPAVSSWFHVEVKEVLH